LVPAIIALIVLPLLSLSSTDVLSAKLNGRKSVSAKTSKSSVARKHSVHKKHRRGERARGRSTARRYTVRGNPEVTRSVALSILSDHLPDLAALVGVQRDVPPDESSSLTTEQNVTTGSQVVRPVGSNASPTSDVRILPGPYVDEELSDEEDPDKITDADLRGLNDLPDDINSFYKEFSRYMATLNGEPTVTDNGVDKVAVMDAIVSWIGTRYLFGGMGRHGIDCSAYTGTLYRSVNYRLPRTAAAQWDVGVSVDKDQLQFGDLVFFNTRSAVYVSHVGMYLGNGYFTHASSRNGVTVSSLSSDYYSTHLIGARRYDVNAAVAMNEAPLKQ